MNFNMKKKENNYFYLGNLKETKVFPFSELTLI